METIWRWITGEIHVPPLQYSPFSISPLTPCLWLWGILARAVLPPYSLVRGISTTGGEGTWISPERYSSGYGMLYNRQSICGEMHSFPIRLLSWELIRKHPIEKLPAAGDFFKQFRTILHREITFSFYTKRLKSQNFLAPTGNASCPPSPLNAVRNGNEN